ncbi:MAG: purine-nucleoside phosphorylase [Rhodothermales bacterium]
MERYRANVEEAARAIRESSGIEPRVAIILGTGLGGLVSDIDIERTIAYTDLPHFPLSTVETHAGKLHLGRLEGVQVMVFQGRFHLYEGYSPQDVTFPVRVAGALGVEALLISNAAGGMNPNMRRGDLMLVTDHINLQGVNPLCGPNADGWGPRFPDMSEPYDVALRETAEQAALDAGIKLHQGVYVAVTGPNLETRAEYRFLRNIGADVVGMSTVPEVIVARHMGIRVMAISVITDECFPDALQPISIPEILAAAATAEPSLTALVRQVLVRL